MLQTVRAPHADSDLIDNEDRFPQSATAPLTDNSSDSGLDEASPFGVQGFTRETLKILKPDSITRLAIALALGGTREQIRDVQFVRNFLARHDDWQDEYRVVRLIEKSLWINGHSDLVMTLTRNPSQIGDNPPPKILRALSRAYEVHPQATVYYGVPLFSEETNADGLPLPLTAAELHAESDRRIAAAQSHALRWGWVYRTLASIGAVPRAAGNLIKAGWRRVHRAFAHCAETWKQARQESQRRTRAAIQARLEHCRYGYELTKVPKQSKKLGKIAAFGLETAFFLEALFENHGDEIAINTMLGTAAVVPGIFAWMAPAIVTPLTVIACDPFLFVELPDEPGKLRFVGHWYWQKQGRGKVKLHLHV